MKPNRRNFLKSAAVLGGASVAGCNDVDVDDSARRTATPTPESEPLRWTGRYVPVQNVDWASHRNLSSSRFGDLFDQYMDQGYIIIDSGANADGSDVTYSMVWRENVDGRGWAQRRNQTSDQHNENHVTYRDDYGFRPLTIEGYRISGELRFTGIWVEDKENLDWWSRRNMDESSFADYHANRKDDDMRLIDFSGYEGSSGTIFSGVWYENVDGVEWEHDRHMTRDEYLDKNGDMWDAGYRTIDFESYIWNGDRRYAAIWEQPADDLSSAIRTGRSDVPYGNWWRQYADMGLRIVNQEHYGDLYAGIWLENADRYQYPHRGELDDVIDDYRDDHDVPGISVAVIENGNMVYRRGFGYADVEDGREAHGRTVYNAASVAKVLGGTLAVKLEDEGELRDGTPVSPALDLDAEVSDYLSVPGGHDYTVAELFAHVGCMFHYDGVSNNLMSNEHYEWATDAVEDLFQHEDDLLDGCSVGEDRNYSTHAFTVAGAVLEQVTDRRIARLIDEEISEPYGLDATRAMFTSDGLPSNSQRAVRYDGNGNPTSYTDKSWKVLGGGIESTAVDLARFAWQVLDGQVVDGDVVEDTLWAPVHDDCESPFDDNYSVDGAWACQNGIAWRMVEYNVTGSDVTEYNLVDPVGTDYAIEDRLVVEHGGSWTGAGSHLAVLPEDDLVIAMTSNRSGGSQPLNDELLVNLTEIILS